MKYAALFVIGFAGMSLAANLYLWAKQAICNSCSFF